MKKYIKIIFNFIMTIVVIIVLLFALLNFFSGPEKKGLFGYKGFIVLSDSMKPSFEAGDYIIDKMVDLKTIQVGDVVSYYDESDQIVTHRVVEITPEGYVLQGDGNEVTDTTFVTTENYIGQQAYRVSKLGTIMLKLSHPLALVGISLLFLLMLIYQKFRGH
ncbi:MAG: signal peptidase I [Enterococcus lemanii]|jgi:signal peptidase